MKSSEQLRFEHILIETANQLGVREERKEIEFQDTQDVYNMVYKIAYLAEKELAENIDQSMIMAVNSLINAAIEAQQRRIERYSKE